MTEGDVNAIFVDSLKIEKDDAREIVRGMLGTTGGKRSPRTAPSATREAKEQPQRYQKPEAMPREPISYQKPVRDGPSAMSNVFGSLKSKLSFGTGAQKEKPRKQKPVAVQDSGDTFVNSVKSKGLNKAMKEALGITDE
jgi:hypothetical protein